MTGLYQSWANGAQIAAQSAQNAQITNSNTGIGGAFGWLSGENVGGYADAFSTVWDSIKGTTGPDTVVYQTTQPTQEDKSGSKMWIGIVVVAVLVVVGALVWLRKK